MKRLSVPVGSYCNRFSARDEGATMIEYGLMVGLIAVVAVVGVTVFGIGVQDLFQASTEQMPTSGP